MKKMFLCYFTDDELINYLQRGYADAIEVKANNGYHEEEDELRDLLELAMRPIKRGYLFDHELREHLELEITKYHEATTNI